MIHRENKQSVSDILNDMVTYQVKLEEYKENKPWRKHYEGLYAEGLEILSRIDPSSGREMARWYARFQGW